MSRLRARVVSVSFLASMLTVSVASAQERLRIAGNFTPDHLSSVAIEQFKADADAVAELQKKGMRNDAMPASEREAMRKATAGVVDDIKKRGGAPFVDQVRAAVKKAGG